MQCKAVRSTMGVWLRGAPGAIQVLGKPVTRAKLLCPSRPPSATRTMVTAREPCLVDGHRSPRLRRLPPSCRPFADSPHWFFDDVGCAAGASHGDLMAFLTRVVKAVSGCLANRGRLLAFGVTQLRSDPAFNLPFRASRAAISIGQTAVAVSTRSTMSNFPLSRVIEESNTG